MDFRPYLRDRLPQFSTVLEPDVLDELAQHLEEIYREGRGAGLDHETAFATAIAAIPASGEAGARAFRRPRRRSSPRSPSGVLAFDRVALVARSGAGTASFWRRIWRWPGLALGDASHTLRLLTKSPAFACASVMTLAAGIAGTTSVFALADALLFQDIPAVERPDRVVQIARTTNGRGWGTLSPRVVARLDADAHQLQSIAALSDPRPLSFSDGGRTERVWGWMASANFFDVIGVTPALGRLFRDEDDIVGAPPAVVLSHRFWQARFGGDPDVLSRSFSLNGIACVVVGVAAPGFDGLTFVGGDLWIPTSAVASVDAGATASWLTDPANTWLRAVGRLTAGASIASASAELNAVMARIKQDTPSVPDAHGIVLATLSRTPVPARPAFTAFVALLFALAGALLAIVCSNVVGMLLARAAGRRREIATRLALGASRGRVIGQLLIETLVLFGLAGLCAIPLTIALLHSIASLLPRLPGPVAVPLAVTARGVAVAAAVSLAAGLVFGLAPARYALRLDLTSLLQGHASTPSRDRLRLRHALVAAQVAMSLALVITAGSLVRSVFDASRADLGFRTVDVDVITLDTTLAGATGADPRGLVGEILDRVRTLPGVESAGHAFRIPLVGGTFSMGNIRIVGANDQDDASVRDANWDVVSPGYFRTVGLPIMFGRDFTASDRAGSRDVAIVNETFARLAWPGQHAIGRRFVQLTTQPPAGRVHEVVGVVRNSPYQSIGEPPRPVIYAAFAQHPLTHVELFVRHEPGRSQAADIGRIVSAVRPALPVVATRRFEDAAAVSLMPWRGAAALAGGGGMLGLYLSALGLYALVTLIVAQRSREFAIRLALGASPAQVKSMVLRGMLWLAAGGGVAGFGLAAGLGTIARARGLLIDQPAVDPLIFGIAGSLVVVVIVASTVLAVRRMGSLDLARAIRAG